MEDKIRVMVVDDSAFMRRILSNIINSDEQLTVVATAMNGEDAIKKIPIIEPDVITLDVIMPKMNGLETLKYIMEHFPKPVIMISSQTDEHSDVTIRCFEMGAIDVIHKPSGSVSLDIYKKQNLIFEKIKYAANANLQIDNNKVEESVHIKFAKFEDFEGIRTIVGVGISTGGPKTLFKIIPMFPEKLGAPILISQHMPENFTKSFADRLNELSSLYVKEAEDGEIVKNNTVYIAKGGHQLLLRNSGEHYFLRVSKLPETIYKPSVDLMFNSISENFSGYIVGVIMTGMGKDGSEGLKRIQSKDGYIIAQDKETSVVCGMPCAARKAVKVDKVLAYNKIPAEVVRIISEKKVSNAV